MSVGRLVPRTADHRLVVAALGLTEIIGYGTLYYAFSVLAPSIAHDLDWSSEWVFGAFSVALLAGGLVAPAAGRWADRSGAGLVMTVGSVAAAVFLAAAALAPGRVSFVAALIAMEAASTLVQYGIAFTLLVQIDHQRAARNITYLTLIAGFASTLFWPATATLLGSFDWREIFLIFAASHLVICMPLHVWLSRLSRPRLAQPEAEGAKPAAATDTGILSTPQRPRGFAVMLVGFSLMSFVSGATLVHMLPMLDALGLGASAVVVGSLFGPAQVLSRLINMVFGARLPAPVLTIVAAALGPLAIAILVVTAPWLPGAVVFSIVFGLGSGIGSIVQGTLPLYLFGRSGYGALMGKVVAARLIFSAAAPFAFAFAETHLDASAALAATAVLGAAAIAAFVWIARLAHDRRPRSAVA